MSDVKRLALGLLLLAAWLALTLWLWAVRGG